MGQSTQQPVNGKCEAVLVGWGVLADQEG